MQGNQDFRRLEVRASVPCPVIAPMTFGAGTELHANAVHRDLLHRAPKVMFGRRCPATYAVSTVYRVEFRYARIHAIAAKLHDR